MRKKSAIYLAGRMDHELDKGHEWRALLTPFLEELGFDILNPYEFEIKQLQGLRPGRLPKGFKHWVELCYSDNPDHVARFVKYMRRIIQFDIDLIKKDVDYIIALWDKGCATGAGTHAELTFAVDCKVPVYCVTTAKMPYWARACCDEVFPSFDELKLFLKEEFGKDDEDKGSTEEAGKTNKKSSD
jgi:nucleoside 2-deoxyribosyltransferase